MTEMTGQKVFRWLQDDLHVVLNVTAESRDLHMFELDVITAKQKHFFQIRHSGPTKISCSPEAR